MVLQRCAPDNQPEGHIAAVTQRQVYGPLTFIKPELSANNEAVFWNAARILDASVGMNRTFESYVPDFLCCVRFEADPRSITFHERFNVGGMERGRPGPGIDLCLQIEQAQAGKINILHPPNDQQGVVFFSGVLWFKH